MPLPRPERPSSVKEPGALSGNVQLDDGERVYVAAGDVIAGKYKVDRVLGVGGVGFVLAARHVDLDGYFALKFLKRRFLQDKTIVERFTREARAACRIKSEYIARVYDVGLHGGAPFIVMEHLVGRDLADLLAERGAFSVGDVTEYAVQACSALAMAHASGVVHRDIKPENLFLVDHEGLPTIKLLDFGISKISLAAERPAGEWPSEGEPLTGRLICGTPYYMSPEQIRSTATVDARSDVWSLGMVLYELLSGNTAFVADSIADVCSAILEKEPRALVDLRQDIPAGLSDVIARCLRKDPDDRFPSIAELAVALLPFAPPRALAIAEGSAWIRRAAIHTLGASAAGDDARVSSGSIPPANRPSSRSSPTGPRQGTPVVIAPALVAPALDVSAMPSQKGRLIAAAGAALVLAIAGGAFAMLRGDRSVKHDVTSATAAESAAVMPPATPRAIATETADRSAAAGASQTPSAGAPPRTPSAAPAHAPPPVHHYSAPPAPPRPQASVKASPSSSSPASPDTATATPAPTPSKPDLGY
jgi:eukaryotic-like serine/threonine-protein kinase